MRSLLSGCWRLCIAIALALAASFSPVNRAFAQNITIAGNHAAEASALTARAAATRPIDVHLILAIHDEAGLDRLIAALHDPASPNFHHWLTPAEFNRRFGPTQADFDAVIDWLKSEGVAVGAADREGRYIDFTVPAAEAERLFNVTIAASADGRSYANLSDPSVPARFASVIAAVDGLDNLRHAYPTNHRLPPQALPGAVDPSSQWYLYNNGLAFGPLDLRTFYDEGGALDGNGQCIGLVEDSDWLDEAVTLFDTQFGLPTDAPMRLLPDNSKPARNGDEVEALLDIEWAHAVAPSAGLNVYLSDPKHPKIGVLVDSIAQAVNDNTCSTLSISFTFCGGSAAFYNKTLDGFFKRAVAQGISVFVSSGDAGSDNDLRCGTQGASPDVNEMAADPNVTAVGGTMFTPNYDQQTGNDIGSVPETVWNVAPSPPFSGGASGGGASKIFSKPGFQNGLTPSDGHRDIPDVAMIAGPPGVFWGDDAAGSAIINCCEGGTSLAAPLFAGIFALINQNQGRVGNANFGFYQLGPNENSMPIGLRDVTSGNNGFNGVPGFSAGTLYDQATGWGTPDIDQLIAAWKNDVKPPPIPVKLVTGPKKLNLGKAVFGVTGDTTKAKLVTITNPGGANGHLVTFTSITADKPALFNVSTAITNGCSQTLAPGHNCKVSITYTPDAQAVETGNLAIVDNTVAGQSTVPLTGKGVAGAIKFQPGKLNFPKQAQGTTSTQLTVTVTNPNAVDLMITNVAVTGDFIIAHDGCTGVLPAAAHGTDTCTVDVEFAPSQKGLRKGTLVFTDDGVGGSQGVGLTGTGN